MQRAIYIVSAQAGIPDLLRGVLRHNGWHGQLHHLSSLAGLPLDRPVQVLVDSGREGLGPAEVQELQRLSVRFSVTVLGEAPAGSGLSVLAWRDLSQLYTLLALEEGPGLAKASAGEERFPYFVVHPAELLIEMDPQARITFIRGDSLNLLGYTPEELIGVSAYEMVPDEERDTFREILVQILQDHREIQAAMITLRSRSGNDVHMLARGIPVFDDERQLIGIRARLRDLGRNEYYQINRQLRDKMFELLRKVSRIMSSGGSIEDRLRRVLAHAGQSLGLARTWLMVHNQGDTGFSSENQNALLEEWHRVHLSPIRLGGEIPPVCRNNLDKLLNEMHPRITRRGECNELEAQILDHLKLGSMYCTPLQSRDHSIAGLLGFGEDSGNLTWDRETQQVVQLMAEILFSSYEQERTRQRYDLLEQVHSDMTENIGIGLMRTLGDGTLVMANHALAQMFGFDHDNVLGLNAKDFYYDITLRDKLLQDLRAGVRVSGRRVQVVDKQGRPFWCSIWVRYFRGPDGRDYLDSAIVDIDLLHRTQLALAQERDLFNAILQSAGVMLLVLDKKLCIRHFNRACEDILGIHAEEAIGRCYDEVFEPLRNGLRLRELREAFSLGKTVRDQYLDWQTPQGGFVRIEYSMSPLLDEQSALRYIIVSGTDVTRREQAEQQLLLRGEAMNAAFSAIMLVDNNEHVVWVNRACAELTGIARDQLLGRSAADLLEQPKGFFQQVRAHLRRSPGWRRELVIRRPDGKVNQEEVLISAVEGARGELTHFVIIRQEISQRIQAEAERRTRLARLLEEDRQRTLLTLLTGVTHEINNPNNFIMLSSPLLKEIWQSVLPLLDEQLKDDPDYEVAGLRWQEVRGELPELLDSIGQGSDRIRSITTNLNQYVHEAPTEQEPVQLNRVVSAAAELLSTQLRRQSSFHMSLGDDLPTVKGIAVRLQQMVINLLRNSLLALGDGGGSIIVRTWQEGEELVLEVEDSGCGIPPENLDRVTDPFFTTWRQHGCQGLGLSIAERVVHESGGRLLIESPERKGTRVRVIFS